ncbi:MAG: GNAT family N-acetyltransferase [Actinotalea sp.]|nr:GNAT family N-acetyltransferase [Actinotalea sp.]
MTRWGGGLGGTRSDAAAVTDVDLHEALVVCDRDPVASVLAATRIEATLAEGGSRAGTALWGFRRHGRLEAVCWAGANLVPVCAPGDEEALDAFARTALRQGRRCSSIVGDADAVLGLWRRLEPRWGPAREVRSEQPSLVIDHEPLVEPDPAVRPARPDEIGAVLPACVHMFVEEVGYSPVEGGGTAYASRVRSLIAAGRSFVRMESGPDGAHVVFKAELGAVTPRVAQVQGVWVTPGRRGQGLSAPGMAAVVRLTRARVAPVVSLYVNHYNARALASYERVGFRRVGTYATVLF